MSKINSVMISIFIKHRKFRNIMILVSLFLSVIVLVGVTMLMMKPAITSTKTNPEISVEKTEEVLGREIPLKVKATGDNSNTCFVIAFDGECAGLSDTYNFIDEKITVTDIYEKEIIINREIGEDKGVNYYFNLENGQKTEFELSCTSGVYVITNGERERYLSLTSTDDEAIRNAEVEEMIYAENISKIENLTEASLNIVSGSGADLALAKLDASGNENLELMWVKSNTFSLRSIKASMNEKLIAQGDATDTISYTIIEDISTGDFKLVFSGEGAMTDYTASDYSTAPWYPYRTNIKTIVIGDGITSIGAYSFYNYTNNKNLSLGENIVQINTNAFASNAIDELNLPSGIKRVEERAFLYCKYTSVLLPEGLEYWGTHNMSAVNMENVHLPSTITYFSPYPAPVCSSFTVEEGNEVYFAVDGVLYERASTGKIHLSNYPINKKDTEFVIPDFVNSISHSNLAGYSFNKNQYLKKLTIPGSVNDTSVANVYIYQCAIEEIVIEDGAVVATPLVSSCPNLKKVVIPEDTTMTHFCVFNSLPSLETIYIPSSITFFNKDTFGQNTNSLESVYYNAKNARNFSAQSEVARKYDLTIGEKVDYLKGKESSDSSYYKHGFQSILLNSRSICFVGENQITISEEVFADKPSPLNALVGTVWVDSQGIVYKYNSETLKASVSYVPFGIREATIPATITPEDGVSCVVNSVDTYAFRLAENLETLNFEDPSVVESIGAYGISYCNKLSDVNGFTSVEEATAIFTNENISVGYRTFYFTSLDFLSGDSADYSEINGIKNVVVSADNVTDPLQLLNIYIDETGGFWNSDSDIGMYETLTGNSLFINMGISNPIETDDIYRVYFEFSELEGNLSILPGTTSTIEGTEITCYATEAPNIVYVEFSATAGKTLNAVLEAVYPSPESAGGSLRVWGMTLSPDEVEQYAGKVIQFEENKNLDGTTSYINALNVQWKTKADDFKLTKSSTGSSAINITGDGNGTYYPKADLSFSVKFEREDTSTSAFGKDYIKSVEFYDYIDINSTESGVYWKEDVVENIKSGNVRYYSGSFYVDDVVVARISNSGEAIQNAKMMYDEEKGVVIYWRITNTNSSAEIATTTTTLYIYAKSLSVDTSLIEGSLATSYILTNKVDAKIKYTYSPLQELSSTAQKELKAVNGAISFSRSVSAGGSVAGALYFGEEFKYTISVFNNGSLPFFGNASDVYTVKDVLSPYTYITADNIEKMFADEYGKTLNITITDAIIYPRAEVTSQDGKTAYTTGTNTDVEALKETLTLSYNREQEAIEILRSDGSKNFVKNTLQETFDSIGYSVGFDTAFSAVWTINENENLKLLGGQYEYFYVYITNKDTFMMLDGDYRHYYPTDSTIKTTNSAYLYRNKTTIHSGSNGLYMKREAFIYKSAKLNGTGESLENDFSIELNDIIDYTIEFIHEGQGEYENLPLVDNIYGTQVLLVPVDQNPQLAGYSLGTVEVKEDGEDVLFYKLSKDGIYKNVIVGLNENNEYMKADNISVTAVGEETEITVDGEIRTYSGLQTSITWYYSELKGEKYSLNVNYHTYIDAEQLHSSFISAGNIVWMNDKTKDRIYDYLWGNGSLLEFGKDIMVKNEDGSISADADKHTIVSGGENVVYRLRLENPNEYKYSIKGSYFYDELPSNEEIFSWEKDVNLTLSYEESEDVIITNLDSWYIDDKMYGVYQHGKYYIKWTDETLIELEAGAVFDMYVTLTFPENTSSSNLWSQYYQSLNGSKLYNTFNVYGNTETVFHSLKDRGKAVLQKGVYGTYRYTGDSSYYTFSNTPQRYYYNNKDISNRAISYYVVLYNDGYSKLYLNDIYDDLPEGFSFMTLTNATTLGHSLIKSVITPTSNPFASVSNLDGDGVRYVSSIVEAQDVDGGVKFKIVGGSGSETLKYDIESNKYYLAHGEAIVFGYVCDIGETTETQDIAINSIGMEFYDYLEAGVQLADKDSVDICGKLTEIYDEQNDGDISIKYGKELKGIYGFAQNIDDSSQWLISDVTVKRGGIIPGVTNYTDSYVNSGTDTVINYTTSVSPFATVNWRSRLHNSGTYSITDYTFIDELPAPYGLTGTVSMDIYDNIIEKPYESYTLFTVLERSDDYIIVNSGNNNGTFKIMLDGTSTSIPAYRKSTTRTVSIDISVTRDEKGQEILNINFADRLFSIPENGGYADIKLSTVNVTNVYENTVYTNFGYLIPNVQEYDSAAQGSIVYENSDVYGVVNSSPANVSIGYSTTSLKKVEENSDEENFATSNSEKKYILLKNNENDFKYTLTVTNDTKNGMTKLILIDSLPQVGDHSPFDKNAFRNSEFKVLLSEEPDFTLTVYPEEGESYVVSPSYYTIGYKESQDFVSEDWSGTSIWSQWSEEAENVRSIRLLVNDSTGEQIPAGAKIEFSFNAKVDDETAAAGMTAWNSFGYHYGLLGVPIELEAMPLSVGVKIPDVPTLQKKLIDLKGDSYVAEEDTSFTYRIYKGDEESEIYTDVTLTVKAGESASEKVKLILEGWEWETGESYVIAEHIGNEDYVLTNWNNRLEKAYTFKYDPDVSVAIKCTNIYKKWSFEILKTDGYNENRPLRGAVFALYSPKEEDKITDEEYARLTLKPEKIIVDENGTQWYLKEILVTDNQGKCKFNDLRQTSYYLVEIKAPDGYKLEFEPRVVTNKAISSTIEVKNYSMPKLPFTGAKQNPTVLIGGVLFGLSLFAIVFILRKRKI